MPEQFPSEPTPAVTDELTSTEISQLDTLAEQAGLGESLGSWIAANSVQTEEMRRLRAILRIIIANMSGGG